MACSGTDLSYLHLFLMSILRISGTDLQSAVRLRGVVLGLEPRTHLPFPAILFLVC
jgi:hypothetical protein